jgi:hypothetical protein
MDAQNWAIQFVIKKVIVLAIAVPKVRNLRKLKPPAIVGAVLHDA